MIDYVGDLSKADAALLRSLAGRSRRILEFGAGASTQIFAAYGAGPTVCVETDPEWIERTLRNLGRLREFGFHKNDVRFERYGDPLPATDFDLVFVDGVDELRRQFALTNWPALAVGGMMAFHDTRRTKAHGLSKTTDVENVCAVVCRYSPEIDSVILNAQDSNITLVRKRAPLMLEDWNVVEGRTPEQIGIAG